MEDGHAKTVDEVLNYFSVDPERGLSLDQVKRNQEKYGPNGECQYIEHRYIYALNVHTSKV
jgi:Ca2+ transporting ATPase